MSDEVLRAVASFVFACDLPKGEVDILWHAGEPMAAGLASYEHAFEIINRVAPPGIAVHHVIQTNGTLITPEWCALLSRYHVRIGLSIDGPAEIHDASRQTWNGKATHNKAMRGYHLLREAGLSPGIICVLTRESLRFCRASVENGESVRPLR